MNRSTSSPSISLTHTPIDNKTMSPMPDQMAYGNVCVDDYVMITLLPCSIEIGKQGFRVNIVNPVQILVPNGTPIQKENNEYYLCNCIYSPKTIEDSKIMHIRSTQPLYAILPKGTRIDVGQNSNADICLDSPCTFCINPISPNPGIPVEIYSGTNAYQICSEDYVKITFGGRCSANVCRRH
jgi:hypothetical protein